MSTEEFNRHLAGALHHPFPMFVITRLSLALKHVVDATGATGEQALRDWCARRDAQDEEQGEVLSALNPAGSGPKPQRN
jgi:hypothetical protein